MNYIHSKKKKAYAAPSRNQYIRAHGVYMSNKFCLLPFAKINSRERKIPTIILHIRCLFPPILRRGSYNEKGEEVSLRRTQQKKLSARNVLCLNNNLYVCTCTNVSTTNKKKN